MMRARCTSTVRGLNAEFAARLLVGSAPCDPPEHIALACREAVVAGKAARQQIILAIAVLPGADHLAHAGHDRGGIEWLFDEVERAVADSGDRRRDVAAAGHDEDRRWIALRVEPSQQLEAGAARQVDVEQNTVGRAQAAPPSGKPRPRQSS